jgi:hypothetical protein
VTDDDTGLTAGGPATSGIDKGSEGTMGVAGTLGGDIGGVGHTGGGPGMSCVDNGGEGAMGRTGGEAVGALGSCLGDGG